MQKLKRRLTFVVLLLAIGGYAIISRPGNAAQLEKMGLSLPAFLTNAPEETQRLSQELSERSTEILGFSTSDAKSAAEQTAEHAQAILQQEVQVSSEGATPLHERAFEYAQYQYCKQVVLEYEN